MTAEVYIASTSRQKHPQPVGILTTGARQQKCWTARGSTRLAAVSQRVMPCSAPAPGILAARPHLGVNEQWPSPRLADYNGIVNGETVIGQAVNDPAPDLDGLPQNIDHLKVTGAGDLVGLAGRHPLPNGLLSVAGGEGTCHNTRHSGMADQTGKCDPKGPLLTAGARSTAKSRGSG